MLENPAEAGEMRTYLIMERINPPVIKFTCVRDGILQPCDGMSELGIFSYVFTKNTPEDSKSTHKILNSGTMGTLLRTKCSHFNEGGVNAGYAYVDSPFFVDSNQFNWEEPLPFV